MYDMQQAGIPFQTTVEKIGDIVQPVSGTFLERFQEASSEISIDLVVLKNTSKYEI